jgi:hypothetical protein
MDTTMSLISPEGQLVLSLHQRADRKGHVVVKSALADLILYTIATGKITPAKRRPTGALVGLELRSGRVASPEAKEIRQAALGRLRDYTTFLDTIDAIGYTPQVLRAAIMVHYDKLCSEGLGSDGNCALMDIEIGLKLVPPKVREVIELLAAGYGPQSVGDKLGVNGSRLASEAFDLLSAALEGGQNGSKTQ